MHLLFLIQTKSDLIPLRTPSGIFPGDSTSRLWFCSLWRNTCPTDDIFLHWKNGKNPKAEAQSGIWTRHSKSSPVPTSLHLPEPLHAAEQRNLCGKPIKVPSGSSAGCPGERCCGRRREEAAQKFPSSVQDKSRLWVGRKGTWGCGVLREQKRGKK